MNPLDLNLFWYGPLVRLLEQGLRELAVPLQQVVSPGLAGGLAIILFTIGLKLLLLPLSIAQVRSQKAQMALQPEMKELQRKFKADREGMARAQMQLYKERGVNPAAGCLPMLIQLPILFGMYSAMLNLSSQGLTLDQVRTSGVDSGQVSYSADRTDYPLPVNQFVLFRFEVTPRSSGPIELSLPQDQADVQYAGTSLLVGTQALTLTPGQSVSNPNPPNTPGERATMFLRPAGRQLSDGTFDRTLVVQVGQPFLVEVEVHAPQLRVDSARAVVQFSPELATAGVPQTPPLTDVAFKSDFLWLPSLGEPDVIAKVGGFGIPGLLLLLMTLTSFVSQRMITMPTEDPQQQAMMKTMAFMPLMYLFFFLQTPSGLVLYWFVSNLFQMIQQYFTVGLGMLAGDLQRMTGRDFQPPWAHVPAMAQAPVGRAGQGTRATRIAASDTDENDTNTTARTAVTNGVVRRRPARAGKGRKRGKR